MPPPRRWPTPPTPPPRVEAADDAPAPDRPTADDTPPAQQIAGVPDAELVDEPDATPEG